MGIDQDPTIATKPSPEARPTATSTKAAVNSTGGGASKTTPGIETTARTTPETGPKTYEREKVVTHLKGKFELGYDTQFQLFEELKTAYTAFAGLSSWGESQGTLRQLVEKLVEKNQSAVDDGTAREKGYVFENANEINLALRAMEVYEGLTFLGLGYKATDGGKKPAEVDLTELVVSKVDRGRGLDLLNHPLLALDKLVDPMARGAERLAGPVVRFFIKDEDQVREVKFDISKLDTKVISDVLRLSGAEGWSQEQLKKHLEQIESLKVDIQEAIGLQSFLDPAERNLSRILNLQADPGSESGGIDRFRNHQLMELHELKKQAGGTLDERQWLEAWLTSYDKAVIDLFEDMAREMETEKDKGLITQQQSRKQTLEGIAAELKQGRAVTPADLTQINTEIKTATEEAEATEAMIKVRQDLDAKDIEMERLAGVLGVSTADKAAVIQAVGEERRSLNERIDKTRREMEGLPPAEEGKVNPQAKALADELARFTGALQHLNDNHRAYLQAFADRKTLEEQESLLKQQNSDLADKSLTELTKSLKEKKGALESKQQDKAQKEKTQTSGREEVTAEEQKTAEMLIRIAEIVGRRNEIKGLVLTETPWLDGFKDEINLAIRSGNWDKVHDRLLELIFRRVGAITAIDLISQQRLLDKATTSVLTLRALNIPQGLVFKEGEAITDDEAFAKIAPLLARNRVETNWVIGSLIDHLHDEVVGKYTKENGRAELVKLFSGPGGGGAVELTPSSIDQPPGSYEAQKVIDLNVGEARISKNYVEVETPLLQASGVKTKVEMKFVGKTLGLAGTPHIKAGFGLLLDDNAYDYFVRSYTDRTEALGDWPEEIVNYFYISGFIKPRDQVVNHQFMAFPLGISRTKWRDISGALASLNYGVKEPLTELESSIPAAVARTINTEKDQGQIEKNKKLFADFQTATYVDNELSLNIAVSFKDGRFWITYTDPITGKSESEWLTDFENKYKARYMKTKGIVDEADLKPVRLYSIRTNLVNLWAAIGKEALNALQK